MVNKKILAIAIFLAIVVGSVLSAQDRGIILRSTQNLRAANGETLTLANNGTFTLFSGGQQIQGRWQINTNATAPHGYNGLITLTANNGHVSHWPFTWQERNVSIRMVNVGEIRFFR